MRGFASWLFTLWEGFGALAARPRLILRKGHITLMRSYEPPFSLRDTLWHTAGWEQWR